MKNKFYLILICILILFTSCTYLSENKKVNNHYTSNLIELINTEDNYTCSIFDMNLYKEKDLNTDDFYIVGNFTKALNEKSFTKKPNDLDEKPAYKMMLTFHKEKYVINIYNSKYVAIHPWDGDKETDYIDMTNIPLSYNLFYLCNYIFSGKY
ncbi:DUF4883 family protein [Clostridium sp. MSJ-11]|uniref:DUF4883 family protein n=1 Tax=Clostridium mobile TaxID=2841512 RepID=A0ABS6EI30_9CLOT|nr:DUF4883 family protein [Clostridium mobile]MBU5484904.1 DUF4883 family protein [Clostridium mobile]